MKLSESLYEIAKNNTYIDSKWLNAYARHISKLEARVAELEAQIPQWISVQDELPSDERRLIIFTDKVGIYVGNYLNSEWITNAIGKVTHWMPLPKAPEVSDETIRRIR